MQTVEMIWQDDDLLVVAKPVGLLVDSGGREPDLVSWAHDLGFRSSFAFHRLDRDTSGLVLMGKTRKYAREVTEMFEKKTIRKSYLAVVQGAWLKTLSKVEAPIEERPASTTFRCLAASGEASLLECLPKTGRTHQIRIHCASSGHAICGDGKYGLRKSSLPGHALHAYRLDLRHPKNGETVSLRSEPREWRETWLKEFDLASVWPRLFNLKKDESEKGST